MRRLLILPIVHSRSDLGSLQPAVCEARVAALGESKAQAVAYSIDAFWVGVRTALIATEIDFSRTLIYQDGLPKVPNVALQIEKQIVDDLAKGGSPNHRIVQWMMQQGAALIGTESPELLMQEYHAIRRNLAQGFRTVTDEQSVRAAGGSAETQAETSIEDAPASLLEQRDRFIALRIDETLGEHQQGILFIGMLHQVELFLPHDVQVEYPVGRPKVLAPRLSELPIAKSHIH